MAQIKIKQIKSRITAAKVPEKRPLMPSASENESHSVVKEDTPSVMGMVNKVRHLVEVTKA